MSNGLADPRRGAFRRTARWLQYRQNVVWGVLVGAMLLGVGANTILESRSLKYPAMFVAAGIAASFFLTLREKQNFLLFASAFSLPYFFQIVLMERDQVRLTVTGHFLIVALLGGLVVATRPARKARWNLEPAILIPALFCLSAGLLSLVNTTDRTMTLLALVRQAEMILIFLILVNSVRTRDHLASLAYGLYTGFGLQCIIYVIQNVLGFSFDVLGNVQMVGATDLAGGRIGSQRGTFDAAPAVAALYFSLVTLSLIGLYLCGRAVRARAGLPVLGMVAGGVCLGLSAKRAPLAGFVLGVALITLLLLRHARGALRRFVPILSVLLVPALVIAPVLILRMKDDHAAAYDERKNLTRVAWEMFHANPIAGVGLGTYDTVKRGYLPPDWSGWLYVVHNNYLYVLAETGSVGLTALLLLFLMVTRRAYLGIRSISRPFRPLQISLLAGLGAVFWEMLWDMFAGKQQDYILWLLISLVVILPRVLPESPQGEAL